MTDLSRLLAFRTLPPALRYGAAIVGIAAAALLRAALPVFGLPFLLFVPMLMLIASVLGTGPGLLGVLLATVTAAYVFVEPAFSFANSAHDWFVTGLFALVSLSIVLVSSALAQTTLRREDDLRKLRESRRLVVANETFLQSVLTSSNDRIQVLDLDGRLLSVNEGGLAALDMGADAEATGRTWLELWNPSAAQEAAAALDAARRGDVGRFGGWSAPASGAPRWLNVVVTLIPGVEGQPAKLLCVSRDMTELRQAEEQGRLLGLELQHRVKNSLAIVQAIIRQTLRNAPSLSAAQETIEARLAAMGRSHDLLTRDGWVRTELHAVIEAALDLHADGMPERFTLEGPRVVLSPEAAMSFALLLHELATNAAKYGALSAPGGRVGLTWSTSRVPDLPEPATRLAFTWCETGGPPVSAPSRRGFGSRLIEQGLSTSLRGSAVIRFLNEGVVCDVSGTVELAADQPPT